MKQIVLTAALSLIAAGLHPAGADETLDPGVLPYANCYAAVYKVTRKADPRFKDPSYSMSDQDLLVQIDDRAGKSGIYVFKGNRITRFELDPGQSGRSGSGDGSERYHLDLAGGLFSRGTTYRIELKPATGSRAGGKPEMHVVAVGRGSPSNEPKPAYIGGKTLYYPAKPMGNVGWSEVEPLLGQDLARELHELPKSKNRDQSEAIQSDLSACMKVPSQQVKKVVAEYLDSLPKPVADTNQASGSPNGGAVR